MDKINKYDFHWYYAIKILKISLIFLFILYYYLQNNIIFINVLASYILILGLYHDCRIKNNRKILIIFILFLIWLFSIYIGKIPYLIIKDLFWYSLILNGSFIFHVLILSWIYRICWLNRWEYACYIISRISFVFSLSFIVYLLHLINTKIYYVIKNKNIYSLLSLLYSLLYIINLILRYFIILFHTYAIYIMGLKNKNIEYIDNIINRFRNIEFIILTLSMSVIIGYPRLFLIWSFFFLKKGFDLYYIEYFKSTKDKFNVKKFFLKEFLDVPSKILYNVELKQMESLIEIYKKPYYELFMFDILKFLFTEGKYIGCYDIPELEEGEFPIKTPFKFYSWLELIKSYYINNEIIAEYSTPTTSKYYWRSVEERYNDLMEMCNDINIKENRYDLITDELPLGLNKQIVKDQDNFYLDIETNKFKLKDNIHA